MLNADPVTGIPPLTVVFDGRSSHDQDGSIVDYEWDLDGDQVFNENGAEANARGTAQVQYMHDAVGEYLVALRVTDDYGSIDVDHELITVPSLTNQITVQVTLDFDKWNPTDTLVRLYSRDPAPEPPDYGMIRIVGPLTVPPNQVVDEHGGIWREPPVRASPGG